MRVQVQRENVKFWYIIRGNLHRIMHFKLHDIPPWKIPTINTVSKVSYNNEKQCLWLLKCYFFVPDQGPILVLLTAVFQLKQDLCWNHACSGHWCTVQDYASSLVSQFWKWNTVTFATATVKTTTVILFATYISQKPLKKEKQKLK